MFKIDYGMKYDKYNMNSARDKTLIILIKVQRAG